MLLALCLDEEGGHFQAEEMQCFLMLESEVSLVGEVSVEDERRVCYLTCVARMEWAP